MTNTTQEEQLRFIQRVLESDAPEQDRKAARDMVIAMRKAGCTPPAEQPAEGMTFDTIEDLFPESGAYSCDDGYTKVSAEWLHNFARAIESHLTTKREQPATAALQEDKRNLNRIVDHLQARLTKAERSLTASGFTDCGGELWKPPLGMSASPLIDQIDALRAEFLGKIALREAQLETACEEATDYARRMAHWIEKYYALLAELAQVREENKRLDADLAGITDSDELMSKTIDQLREQAERDKQDAERMDWLDRFAMNGDIEIIERTPKITSEYQIVRTDTLEMPTLGKGATLREAIDASIAKQKEQDNG